MNNKPNGAGKQIEARKSALTLERLSMIQEISAPVSRTLHLIARFENYKTGHICDIGYLKLSELTGIPESTSGAIRKLTKLNLVLEESPLREGMYQNDELTVNWGRVIELSQPVENGILNYFHQRSQMSGGPALTNERYMHKQKTRHKKDIVTLTLPQAASKSEPIPEELPEESEIAVKCIPDSLKVMTDRKARDLVNVYVDDVWEEWINGCSLIPDFYPLNPERIKTGKNKGKMETVDKACSRCRGQLRHFTRHALGVGHNPVRVMREAMLWGGWTDPDRVTYPKYPKAGLFGSIDGRHMFTDHYESIINPV